MQPVRGREPDTHRLLVHHRAEAAQDVQVVVDGAVSDAAPAQVRDEGLPQSVQKRAAEEDRNARGPGVGVDVRHMGALDAGGVQGQDPLGLVVVNGDPVQAQQPGDHVHVTDEGHVAQHRRGTPQQRRHHGLGYEVLCAAHRDLAAQWAATVDLQQSVDHRQPPSPQAGPEARGGAAGHGRPRIVARRPRAT